jgi:hypothetical protein
VQGPLVIGTLPGNVTGGGSGSYAGGNGIRINWKTSTLQGRRLIKGATYLAPLAANAFTSTGGINTVISANATAAASAYIAAMHTAVLYPVIWHRPAKGTTTGGMWGGIVAGVASTTPCSLRSRRS